MIYDSSNELDRKKAEERFKFLVSKGSRFELSEIRKRSLRQNSYLHILLGILALDQGETMDYVKEYYYKRHVNRHLFVIVKQDKILGNIETLRSSKDLTVEEMSASIEKLRNWASNELGCYLPSADEESLLRMAEAEIERYKQYL
jgi:hypothetical protein